MNDTKLCAKCGIDKPKSEYHKLSTKACGVQSKCKECMSAYKKERYWGNHEVELAKMTKSRLKPENEEQRKGYYQARKDEYRARYDKYKKDPGFLKNRKEVEKKRYNENRDAIRERHKKNYERPEAKEAIRKKHHERKLHDTVYLIKRRLRFRLRNALKASLRPAEKHYPTMELLGCSMDKLKLHIEEQFTVGMCWERISEIDIDHIRPCASFNLLNPVEQKNCFHYTNLQPLWKEDNLKKGAKILCQKQP